MDGQEKYEYWLALAQEDLRTAEAMHNAGRWLYVAFCCQQAIEKLVKGLYGLYIGFDGIPHTHNISRLMNDFAGGLPEPVPQETADLFDILTKYYISNRYPDYTDSLSRQMRGGASGDLLKGTKEAFSWLQTLRP
jgi:HEPN domain-containing protein